MYMIDALLLGNKEHKTGLECAVRFSLHGKSTDCETLRGWREFPGPYLINFEGFARFILCLHMIDNVLLSNFEHMAGLPCVMRNSLHGEQRRLRSFIVDHEALLAVRH